MYHQLGTPIELISDVTFHREILVVEGTPEVEGPNGGSGNVDSVTYKNCAHVTFGSTTISAVQIKSFVYGYKIKDRLKQFLREYFSRNIFVVPGEIVRAYSFPNVPNERGIDTKINIPLNHAIEAIVLFPRFPYECTCFTNPQYKDTSLKFLDQSFPDTAVTTTTPEHFKSQLECDLLGEPLQCSESYENSYLAVASGKNGERGYTAVDITNHALSFPLVPPQ
jgi:hypothetical protein